MPTVHMANRTRGKNAIDASADLMDTHGIHEQIRLDNGPEIAAKTLRNWLGAWAPKRFTTHRATPNKTVTANLLPVNSVMNR